MPTRSRRRRLQSSGLVICLGALAAVVVFLGVIKVEGKAPLVGFAPRISDFFHHFAAEFQDFCNECENGD